MVRTVLATHAAAAGRRSGPRTNSPTRTRTSSSGQPMLSNIPALLERDRQRQGTALPHDAEADRLARRVLADGHDELVGGRDRAVVDAEDHIALQQPGARRGPTLAHVEHLRPVRGAVG